MHVKNCQKTDWTHIADRQKEFIAGKKKVQKISESTSTNWCREDPARGLYAAIRWMIASLVEEQVEGRKLKQHCPQLEMTVPIWVGPNSTCILGTGNAGCPILLGIPDLGGPPEVSLKEL